MLGQLIYLRIGQSLYGEARDELCNRRFEMVWLIRHAY
jgi:hypothetical protein